MNIEVEDIGRRLGARVSLVMLAALSATPLAATGETGGLNQEAPPAAVRLRTAALLLSEQQGGELSMVSSVIRRPVESDDGAGIEALLTVELDDQPLREALPLGGDIEGFVYLLDGRLEIFDSVSVTWQLPAPPVGNDGNAGAAPNGAETQVEPAEGKASSGTESDLDPVRFTARMPAPPAGDYVFRILFRAGEHFGLRTLPLSVPAQNDVVPTLMEAVMTEKADGAWASVSPAGRGFGTDFEPSAFPILRRGSRVPLTFSSTSGDGLGAVEVELELDGSAPQRLALVDPAPSSGGFSGTFELPEDLAEGRYRIRLVADQARPSLARDVLVLDSSHPPIRWTELGRLKQQETTLSGDALRLPASERERVITTRRELLQALADLERGSAPALARLRALEASLKKSLGPDFVPFLRKQLAKIVGRTVRRTRDRPDVRLSLVWMFMEHAEDHRTKGRHPLSVLAQNITLEILRVMADSKPQRSTAVDGMVILAGRMQRQRFLSQSEDLLLEALALEPKHIEGLSALASVYERADRAKSAAETLERLVELRPDDGHSRVRLAVAYRRQGDFDQAIAELDRALSLAANTGTGPWWAALAHQEKVRTHMDQRRLVVAQRALKEGLAAFPDDPVLRISAPWLQYRRGHRSDARQALLELPTASDGMNARHRFHSWPRQGLDKLARGLEQRATAASTELAAMANAALEDLQ